MAILKNNHAITKIGSITIVVIVIVICVTAAFIAYQFKPTDSIIPTITPTPAPSPAPSTTATITPASTAPVSQPTRVLMQTTAGNITIQLRTDKPITTTNFINLINLGKYDGTTFHRVIDGFIIQGGKVSGNTTTIQDEIGSNNHNNIYTIAMAKTNLPNSATSEFFINTADNSKIVYQDGTSLDTTYTVFGTVTGGTDVVDAISHAPVSTDPNTGEMSVPVNPVVILHIYFIP